MKNGDDGRRDHRGVQGFHADYSNKIFQMFSGEWEMVELQFHHSLINVVIDRFGKEVFIYNRTKTPSASGQKSLSVTLPGLAIHVWKQSKSTIP